MTDYNALMGAIIKREMAIIGREMAIKIARNVPKLKVDDFGNVESGGSKMAMGMLIQEYKRVTGGLAISFARNAIRSLLKGGEDLPLELKG